MKCDKLQYERLGDANKTYPASTLVIRKQFVDAAIAELKAKLEDVQATAYAESVDAGMENRMRKRALWIARGLFCGRSSEYFSGMASRCKIGQEDFYREVSERARRYMKSSYKCRAKAEEYK